jgi:YHS domain-containing protein
MKTLFSILLIFLFLDTASAQNAQRVKNFNVNKNTLAINGYDPVAYFTSNKGVEGRKDISIVSEGITYYFSSTQNRELFKANPSKYEPQYGGWCAYAMGENGDKVSVDPKTFKILDGKLYLFYNKFVTNTLKEWNKNESALKQKADQNWGKLK